MAWYKPFSDFFPDAEKVHLKRDELPKTNDGILVVWGGGDIHPSLYGRENIASWVGKEPTIRDTQEKAMMDAAIKLGMPIVGVCRGAQLGCALAGGILVQDVSGHGRSHYIKTNKNETLVTSSMHHQMMYPWNVKHELIAWSSPAQSKQYSGLKPDERVIAVNNLEPEIIWFPNIKCLAIQGHPEFMNSDDPFNKYVHKLVEEYCVPNSSAQ